MNEKEQGISLPHLTGEIVRNARKTRLDAFAVALEGWRRGLKLKWYTKDSEHYKDMIIFGVNPPGRLFSLSSETKTHYFFRTRGDLVSNEAVEVGSEKDDTKIILNNAGVPVPKGKGFAPDATNEEIITYCKQIGYPLVVKPTNASLGNGVITNIRTDEELLKALHYVRVQLNYPEIIVEQFVVGKEYRFYVVDDQVIAVYNRIPANIVGDGEHTIEELIDLKNQWRKKNARLNSCLIHMDNEILDFITEAGYTLESVPEKGKLIYLREKTNVSSGGDPIDVTDTIADEYKQIAIDALKAIPGFIHGGVDIIVNEGKDIDEAAVVLELNPTAQIGGALFPLEGKARDIPKAIIDYYFPETIDKVDTTTSMIYFDLVTILEPLENRTALEVEVAPAPLGKLYARKYIVSGNVTRSNYHRWLKKHALELNLNGYVKSMVFDEIEIVVAGTDKENIQEFKQLIDKYPQGSKVAKIKEEIYEEPVTIGFEISEGYNMSNIKSVQHAIRQMDKELQRMTKQKNRIEKDNEHILNSSSWRVTAPIRKLGRKLKK
ncbi:MULTISPECIES: acylphosphatase [unclassified Oceanobacillus]|uniref:acylphosphatase n=1 Tax=unclassified Oceanobacillus TaxID=2630292 RepID=UPI00300E5CBD